MNLAVLVAAGGAQWEAGLLSAFSRPSSQITVARRCVDVVDLLAVAAAGQGRVALVDADLRRLDADAVDRLLACSVVPVGVVGPGDGAAEDRLRALGVHHVVCSDAAAADVAGELVAAVNGHSRLPPAGGDRGFTAPATSVTTPAVAEPARPGRHGTVLAVWGPTGAPGRTTIAVALADEIARLGRSSLVIDADVYGGTVAAVLGVLDEAPGLAAACRQASSGRLDAAALAGHCWQLRPQLRVLTGIPIPARWPELRPAAVTAVLAAARTLADVTVVDCGFCLETDEELSFDSLAPRRNGATLAVLDAADRVIAVGAADPIGMQRLVRGLGELRDAEVTAPVDVVLNKVRRGVVPGKPERELRDALATYDGPPPLAVLPYDREALDLALAAGRTLGEAKPGAAFQRAAAALAAELVGQPQPRRSRRR